MKVEEFENFIKKVSLNNIHEPITKLYFESDLELDLNKRWEMGVHHHPKARELMEHLKELDFCFNGMYFDWQTGGDGDNGEILLYLLDLYFEAKDKGLV